MLENIRLSFQGIWSHKMRSLLTMLGIIIGIASIMAIVSTIKGTNDQIKEQLIGSGRNTVDVQLKQGGRDYSDDYYSSSASASSTTPQVSQDAIDQIMALKEVENVTAYVSGYPGEGVFYGSNGISNTTIYGIDVSYLDTMGYTMRCGRGFIQEDFANYRSVILLDQTAASALFGKEDPLGKSVEISSIPFTIVGVITTQKAVTTQINSVDDYYSNLSDSEGSLYIPKSTWPLLFQFDVVENVTVKATNTDAMTKAGQKAAQILNSYLPDSSSATAAKYSAENLLEQTASKQALATATQRQLILVALISLLVGGIGVMNIMLVSVTERINEIGLKKAIGAPKKAILAQFLTEAAVLTSMGGVLGVISGIVVSQIIHKIYGLAVGIDVTFSAIAVVVSMGIGLIFGFFPSVRAANMDPIEALRRE